MSLDSAAEQQMRRWKVAPDRLLAWLGVTGLVCYGILWLVHQTFYGSFGVSVFAVGVGQAQMVTAAAVFALWFVPLFIYPAVLIRLAFSTRLPKSVRVPALEGAFGALLLTGIVMLFVWVAPLRDSIQATSNDLSVLRILVFFLVSAGLLSLALLFKGLTNLMSFKTYPLVRPIVKWFLIRHYLGQHPTSEAMWKIYLPARRSARNRAARRRAAWRRDFRHAVRTYWLALAAMLGLGLFCAITALALTAEHEAQALIAGRKYETNLLYEVLTPGARARSVQVLTHDPKLRSLEKADVLYLGAHNGVDVLYDRTAKHTVIVPAGAVSMILQPQ